VNDVTNDQLTIGILLVNKTTDIMLKLCLAKKEGEREKISTEIGIIVGRKGRLAQKLGQYSGK